MIKKAKRNTAGMMSHPMALDAFGRLAARRMAAGFGKRAGFETGGGGGGSAGARGVRWRSMRAERAGGLGLAGGLGAGGGGGGEAGG